MTAARRTGDPGLMKPLSMVFMAAALVPAAWSLTSLSWSSHVLWVLAASTTVAAFQLVAATVIARGHEIPAPAMISSHPASFARRITVTSLLVALFAGPSSLMIAGRLCEEGTLVFLVSYGPVLAGTQAIFATAVYRLSRARAAMAIIEAGLPCSLRTGNRSSGAAMFRALVLCAATAALAMGLSAHRLIKAETFSAGVRNYGALLDGLIGSNRLSAQGESTADALVGSLTRFDQSLPFTFDSEGRWRRWFTEDDANTLCALADRSHSGFMLDEWRGVGAIWTTLEGKGGVIGVRLTGVGGEGLPYVVVALLFAAAFGSALVSMKLGSRIREAAQRRARAVDALPRTVAIEGPPAATEEMAAIDLGILEAGRKYAEGLDSSKQNADSGRRNKEEKARVFTSMSHDLRSPLNSVIGFTDLLMKGMDGELSRAQRVTISGIARESERLLVLISDILDTAKLDSGSFELDRRWVPSVEILTDCEAGARRLVANREVKFTSLFEPGLPPVMVDKERVGRALMSVLARVIDSMETGTVTLRASRVRGGGGSPGHLGVEIADPGGHMDLAQRRRIEAALAKHDRPEEDVDTNEMELGLSLAGRILDLHGGKLETDRDAANGVVIRAMIPLDDPAG